MAAAHGRLPTLYDALDIVFDRERIHEGPPTYIGSRATRLLIGQSLPSLTNLLEGTGIHVVLHNRVYVSILSIGPE